MTNFDKRLKKLTRQFDQVVFAHGRYQGYKLTTHVAPIPEADDDEDQWQHIIRLRLRVEGHAPLKSKSTVTHESWESAFKDFKELKMKHGLEAYAPTMSLQSVDSNGKDPLEHMDEI